MKEVHQALSFSSKVGSLWKNSFEPGTPELVLILATRSHVP